MAEQAIVALVIASQLIDDIQAGGEALVYDKGETIFRQGETDSHL